MKDRMKQQEETMNGTPEEHAGRIFSNVPIARWPKALCIIISLETRRIGASGDVFYEIIKSYVTKFYADENALPPDINGGRDREFWKYRAIQLEKQLDYIAEVMNLEMGKKHPVMIDESVSTD